MALSTKETGAKKISTAVNRNRIDRKEYRFFSKGFEKKL